MKLKKISKGINKIPALKYSLRAIWWVLLLILGFMANDVYDIIKAKPSLDIIMPLTPNDKGEFPISIVNNGDKDLEIEKVNIQSCYMNNSRWKHYYPDNIPKSERNIIYFLDENTYNKSQRIDCVNDPLNDWENRRIDITMCRNTKTGESYIPDKNSSFTMCGFCHWDISVETNEGTFDFYEEMFLPIDLPLEIFSEEENPLFDINSSDVICSESIKITHFGTRELEVAGEYD